jgi:signal transduction histidine kinase
MKSKFLPAERSTNEEIKIATALFNKIPYIKIVIDAISNIAMIIDKNRQIVFINKKLTSLLGEKNLESVLGLRPGELLNCKHSINEYGGCGTSDACRYCGAALSIKQSIDEAIQSENECRITVEKQGEISNLDLLVTATPITMENELYVILSISDISNEKRRKILERVFFHDVVNTAGGLRGVLNYLTEEPEENEVKELIEMASVSADQLLEEILSHRSIVAAENGELIVNPEEIKPEVILENTKNSLLKHDVAKDINIEIDPKASTHTLFSDPVILKRVLVNLLKNALEATFEGGSVQMGFDESQDHVTFWVKNDAILSEEIKLQIFQRSFSTKGIGRGIGTYSIKLFTETYLHGKVDFSSEEGIGTIFRVTLPLKFKTKK